MNRRLFLKALGIGAISAPVATSLFNETAPAPIIADPTPRLANGGTIRDGGPYIVGERGPEMVVTIHASRVDPNAIVEAIRKYERRNGTGWR